LSRYRRLAIGVRHEYVKSLFGEPAWEIANSITEPPAPQLTPTPAPRPRFGRRPLQEPPSAIEIPVTNRIWPLGRLGYLSTWCTSADNQVIAYSLTTRSRWLRPTIEIGPDQTIKLGKSRVAELDHAPLRHWARLGARRYAYAEQHYFGNPGHYLHWFVGVLDIGHRSTAPRGAGASGVLEPDQLAHYRAGAIINSVLIAGGKGFYLKDHLPYGIGPDGDTVRMLRPSPTRWGCWWHRRRRRRLVRQLAGRTSGRRQFLD
jgi:hypothetical protein